MNSPLSALALLLMLAVPALGATPKFGVHEIELQGDGAVANPFDTRATLTFTPPSGARKAKAVHAFFDGGNTWRARVYASETGRWTWKSVCKSDQQLDGKSGEFEVSGSKLRGRLLVHPKNPRQWMTEDGRWFLNLNDTSYFLLCSHDGDGSPVSDADVRAYVQDVADCGITSLRSFIGNGPLRFDATKGSDRHRWSALFADEAMTRPNLDHLRVADQRLKWLLDAHPDIYMQLIPFPLGKAWRSDEKFWQTLAPEQRDRLLRHLIARFAAYPQIFWLIVNDAHFAPEIVKLPDGTQRRVEFPNSCAMVREAGEFFREHDPWQHPISAGPARAAAFHFENDDWATYIHLEDDFDVSARRMDECFAVSKPVFLGEDRYEHDHHESRDPQDMRYFQRRLFWAWLLSGGSANYGGRWWVLHPYSQTGARPARSFHHPAHIYDQPLAGLDSVKVIRDFFEQRHVELAAFQPAHALASDPDRRDAVNAPKVMRRAGDEFLLYHPNATGAGRTMEVSASRTARVRLDLTSAPGRFSVEWVRALDGAALPGDAVQGGAVIELAAPWPGADIVLRMQRSQ